MTVEPTYTYGYQNGNPELGRPDGYVLELHYPSFTNLIAVIFQSEVDGSMTFTSEYEGAVPLEVIENFIAEARRRLIE